MYVLLDRPFSKVDNKTAAVSFTIHVFYFFDMRTYIQTSAELFVNLQYIHSEHIWTLHTYIEG